MLALVCLEIDAVRCSDRQNTGIIACLMYFPKSTAGLVQPAMGRILSLTPKKYMSSIPIQNTGVPAPSVARNVISWSIHLPRLIALRTPNVIPNIEDITNAGIPRDMVRGIFSESMSLTDLL